MGIERSIEGLESMKADLEILSILVYDCSMEIFYSEFEQLEEFEILDLLLKNMNEDSSIDQWRVKVFPQTFTHFLT